MAQQTYNDMVIWNNADFTDTLTYFEPDGITPINLTGCQARMDIRLDGSLIISLESATGSGSGENGYITLGTTDGIITFNIPLAVTSTLPIGMYSYDLVLIHAGQQRIFGGTIPVSQGITL